MKEFLEISPISVGLWDSERNGIMFNKSARELFKIGDAKLFHTDFKLLSPEYQPNGELSSKQIDNHFDRADCGEWHSFNWLHCDTESNEIPCKITILKTKSFGDVGEYFVGYIESLSEQLVRGEDAFDFYFHNEISGNALFNSLVRLTNDLVFTLDLRSMRIRYYGKGREIYNLPHEKEFNELFLSEIIFEEDKVVFSEGVRNMMSGLCTPVEVRLIRPDGSLCYNKIEYELIYNPENVPTFVIGKLTDIDDQKSFETQAKMDLLANCYNKISAENEIKFTLTRSLPDQQHVLFIVDIDDFKSVNDTLGHHFGDIVISDVATKLKSCFRSHDVVGRLGGDEFIVLMKNASDIETVVRKADDLIANFRRSYSGEKNDYKISGSVGISRYPLDGTTYEELYKAADKALYQSKKRGKDCYTFYTPDFNEGTMKNFTILENASRGANSYFETEIISTIFNLLYETHDIITSVNLVLRMLGEQFKVDRTYIFESFDGGKTYDNTFEWCNEGVNPEIDNLKGLTAEILQDFFDDASEDGIFFSNDLRVLEAEGAYELMKDQGIFSFLHAQVHKEGYVNLFLGFDDCTGPRIWTDREVNTIKYVAKLLSTYLLLYHAKEGLVL